MHLLMYNYKIIEMKGMIVEMRKISVSDITLKYSASAKQALSFKEKLEIAKLLDGAHVNVIETAPIVLDKADSLCIKAIAGSAKNACVCVPVTLSVDGVKAAWEALKAADKPRLQLSVPVSPVGMEYTSKKKPNDVKEMVKELISECKALCPQVEFVAEDASRAVSDFLYDIVNTAIDSGADIITVNDDAGIFLPDELSAFIDKLYENVPNLKDKTLGVSCKNNMDMATACAGTAVKAGVSEVKTCAINNDVVSLKAFADVMTNRADSFGVSTDVSVTKLGRSIEQIKWVASSKKAKEALYEANVQEEAKELFLSTYDNIDAVENAVLTLGYDLSDEDIQKVYDEFKRLAKNKNVTAVELDAIVASTAMQVPSSYKLISYVINCGDIIAATANIQMEKDGKTISGLSTGDGPIDAAFLAIEQIVGTKYELDDFQIQSITRGRGAMGNAVVKLRSNGKLYSGKGISTDIVGASVKAYVSALNKIVYEEEN